MTTAVSVESVRESFPHQDLPVQPGPPTFEKIEATHAKIKANAASIQSELGGGAHGLLGIALNPETYLLLTGSQF